MLTLDEVRDIHKEVHGLFTYIHDDKQYDMNEHWTSHADDVMAGEEFEDDCDGFALTCAELFIHKGHPREHVSAIICNTETGEGHLVCGILIDGEQWVVENRYKKPYKQNRRRGYDWRLFMTFDKPGTWQEYV